MTTSRVAIFCLITICSVQSSTMQSNVSFSTSTPLPRGSITIRDIGNIADAAYSVWIDGYRVCETELGNINTCAINFLRPGLHTLTVIVIEAPDDFAAFIISFVEYKFVDNTTSKTILDTEIKEGWTGHWNFTVPEPLKSNQNPTNNPITLNPTNCPTNVPTLNPTNEPTFNPVINTNNIIIVNHEYIKTLWIAFNVSQTNVFCNVDGTINSVQITDSFLYKNQWINYSNRSQNEFFIFNNLTHPFTIPISIKITKVFFDGTNETITGVNIITSLKGSQHFDFESNFCIYNTTTMAKKTDNGIYYYLGGGIIVFIVVIVITSVCLHKKSKIDESISNALVVVIAIGFYDDRVEDADINGHCEDLPVEKDLENLNGLFNLLNYKVIPNELKLHWTDTEIISYLKDDVGKELYDENKALKYDGLIICVSCHGIEQNIITSNYNTIEKVVIHRIISMEYPETRDIPRIVVYDSCEGAAQRECVTVSPINISKYKEVSGDFIESDVLEKNKAFGMESMRLTATAPEWPNNGRNPDYKLVQIFAANPGFQAKCNSLFGSYLIFSFTEKMKQNIENKQRKTLATIFEEIQNELHDRGKQQTINIFNNNMGHLQFKINKREAHSKQNGQQNLELEQIPNTLSMTHANGTREYVGIAQLQVDS